MARSNQYLWRHLQPSEAKMVAYLYEVAREHAPRVKGEYAIQGLPDEWSIYMHWTEVGYFSISMYRKPSFDPVIRAPWDARMEFDNVTMQVFGELEAVCLHIALLAEKGVFRIQYPLDVGAL